MCLGQREFASRWQLQSWFREVLVIFCYVWPFLWAFWDSHFSRKQIPAVEVVFTCFKVGNGKYQLFWGGNKKGLFPTRRTVGLLDF